MHDTLPLLLASVSAATVGAVLVSDTGWILWPALIGFILLLTPTGSPPSRRWHWWMWLAAAAPLTYMLAEALESTPLDPPFGSVVSPCPWRSGRPGPRIP